MRIWVDDVRPMPTDFDIHFHTVNETIDYIEKNLDSVKFISLDHDAGDFHNQGGDYIRILDWLEFFFPNNKIIFHIHSKNPVGIKNMEKIIDKNNWNYFN